MKCWTKWSLTSQTKLKTSRTPVVCRRHKWGFLIIFALLTQPIPRWVWWSGSSPGVKVYSSVFSPMVLPNNWEWPEMLSNLEATGQKWEVSLRQILLKDQNICKPFLLWVTNSFSRRWGVRQHSVCMWSSCIYGEGHQPAHFLFQTLWAPSRKAASPISWQILSISMWHFYHYFLKPLFKPITGILIFKYISVFLSFNSYDLKRLYHVQVSGWKLYIWYYLSNKIPLWMRKYLHFTGTESETGIIQISCQGQNNGGAQI